MNPAAAFIPKFRHLHASSLIILGPPRRFWSGHARTRDARWNDW